MENTTDLINKLQALANEIILQSVAAWENVTGEIARLHTDPNTMRTVDLVGAMENLNKLYESTISQPPAPPSSPNQ